jgi:hypothetical protein
VGETRDLISMFQIRPQPPPQPRADVRHGVRALLTAAEGFERLDPDTRREVAGALVRISSTALSLAESAGASPPSPAPRRVRQPLAHAQAADFSSEAVDRIAPTSERILNAVSFPRFVGELITGVFKAMNESNEDQLASYVELIRNVAATTEGFAEANIGASGARQWLAERFPASFEIRGGSDDDGFDDPAQMTAEERAERQAERDAETRLVLRPGAEMPSETALRTALGVPAGESVSAGDPESLVGPAQTLLARNRQQVLATMVMMGMQRIVIDSGRLNASMRFHIDASSAAAEDRGSRFDLRHESEAGAKLQFGEWGASARMKNTIGYVSTERTQTEQELNADLDLDSSVELIFRTDYVPLERLAGTGDVQRIRVNAINPEAEARFAAEGRKTRAAARSRVRGERAERLNEALQPTAAEGEETPLDIPEPSGGKEAPQEEAARETQEAEAGEGEATKTPLDIPEPSGGKEAPQEEAARETQEAEAGKGETTTPEGAEADSGGSGRKADRRGA